MIVLVKHVSLSTLKSLAIEYLQVTPNEKIDRVGLANSVVFIDCPGIGFGLGAETGINGVGLDFSVLRAMGKDAEDELDEYDVAGTRIGC